MRDQIKTLADRLLTLSGYAGMSFGDLTAELGTTRANIHYHFGSKDGLVEEVLEDACKMVTSRYEAIWIDTATTLIQKLQLSMAFNHERYRKYNPKNEGRIWSVITRLRLDRDRLSPRMVELLDYVTLTNQEVVDRAVQIAVENEELKKNAPLTLIAVQIGSVLQYAPLMTQYPYNFTRLSQTYEGLIQMLSAAYGSEKKGEISKTSPVKRTAKPVKRLEKKRSI